jgi:hypothetical protein
MVEETSEEKSYIEHDSYFEDENFDWGGDIVLDYMTDEDNGDGIKFVDIEGAPTYFIHDSVDLYGDNGNIMGYTKPNIVVQLAAKADDWYCVYIDDSTLFLKASDFDENNDVAKYDFENDKYVVLENEDVNVALNEVSTSTSGTASNEASSETSATPSTTSNTTNETSTTTPSVDNSSTPIEVAGDTQSVVDSGKYTPEEAVAVWRGILEANGMTWDPSLPSDGASWGTGWLDLEKGQPEKAAQRDLEGYAYGDGAGNPKTRYYAEITGYDDDYVYMTSWSAR